MTTATLKKDSYEILNAARENGTIYDGIGGFTIIEEGGASIPSDGYDYGRSMIVENETAWFVDLGLGFGFSEYPKTDWTLQEAISSETSI